MESSLQHHFLIAMPSLVDTFFYRSVVYICEHDEEGAMGLIINRPTQIMLAELLSHLEINNPSELVLHTPVLFGGPVQKHQGLVLHNSDADWQTKIQLADNVFLTTSTDILENIGTENGPEHALVTLGYAGWAAGQLEQELTENSWLTVAANDDLLFNTPADQQWPAAAKLLGIDINLMANTAGHA
ncbi:MAG: YqgE/AlgH family protein [Gammaproteobacteria bacterium]|nr:YqgE/AlgH family protein [Gammaproteobacteria bacterium]MDH5592182.1 YqgE/AlgH family protein [Gammaproteobacteria bacterium]